MTITETAPSYSCPCCPLVFYSEVGRDDHVSYRHGKED